MRNASSSTSRKAARSAVVAVIGMGIAFVLLAATPAAAQVIDEADRPAEDQIARLYQAVFGRSADEGGFVFWTEQYRSDGSLTEIAAAFAASPEFVDRYGTNPSDEALVDAMYDNVLGREGDAGGVRFWREQLSSGAVSQLGLLLAFADSPENIERTNTSEPLDARAAQLLRLYRSAFGRFPDAGGFSFWMGEYSEATPLRDIALRFSQSPEFVDIYGESLRPAEVVDRLYLNVLGREGDADGVAFWETEYRLGRSIPEMLVAFADSAENLQRTGTASNPSSVAATPVSRDGYDIFTMKVPAGACGGISGPAGVILDESPPDPGSDEGRILFVGANYADLNADGATDIIVELQCESGNAIWSDAVVWIAGREPALLDFNQHVVVSVRGITEIDTSRSSASVDPGVVQIEWAGIAPGDARCCPRSMVTTEITMVSGQIVATDTFVDGPQLNAVRVLAAAQQGGPLPADLPVDAEVWDELVEWLEGTAAIIDSEPCFFAVDDAVDGRCIFATPDSPNGESVFLSIRPEGADGTWTVYEWDAIVHAT